MNYQNKKFRAVVNSANGEVNSDMVFHYFQKGDILTCNYHGEKIQAGHLIGIVDQKGCIEMRYHQINSSGELVTGICRSTPEVMENGKIRLLEEWQWTSGDQSKGHSILEEL